MAYLASGSARRQIEALFEGASVAGLSDRQLLERFIADRGAAGEIAFAALVQRHGPMVLDVCRQLLGDLHHAEDAFQAVFLVLARRARSIRDPDLLGNWLYGVALRTARCARLQLVRRRKKEEGDVMRRPGPDSAVLAESILPPVEQPAIDREQAEALHCEIGRLPEAFRLPVVLCYFEGLTIDEAARRLRWPVGTIGSRLARAREKLKRGLTRRGIVLPSGVLATLLAPRSTSAAAISSPLCRSTTTAAMKFAAGQAAAGAASASATALAQEVLRSMLLSKFKVVALSILFLGAMATGVGLLAHSPAMNDGPKPMPVANQRSAAIATTPDVAAPGRMRVVGRVLDSSGVPMRGAVVEVIGRRRQAYRAATGFGSPILLGRGGSQSDGQFQLDAARTSSTGFFDGLYVVAMVPGFGLGWATLNPDAEQPVAEIRLQPEQLIRGKLVDLSGQPAAGVELPVDGFGEAKNFGLWSATSLYNRNAPEDARAWPRGLKTDGQGRFELHGVGRGLSVSFVVNDRRFAQQWLGVATDDRDGPKKVTLALQPAKIIEGQVLDASTGQPIPGAVIEVGAETKTGIHPAVFHADNQGQFQANPFPADHFKVSAFPADGMPYLPSRVEFAWNKGAVKKEIVVKLTRGTVIKGKVVEENTGRALAEASVQYLAINGSAEHKGGWEAMVASKDDGSYQIVVPPGKGHLLVFGPTADFILDVIGGRTLDEGLPGGERHYAHKIMAYDVKAGDPPRAIDAVLRRGKTIKGRVVGPRGETVEHAAILTRLQIEPFNTSWRGDASFQPHARDGCFELHGLNPDKAILVYFLDADHQWGGTIEISGKPITEPMTVQLQRNGQAKARFVATDGRPLAKLIPPIEIVVTPGPPPRRGELFADTARLIQVDPQHYYRPNLLRTDADGRVTLPDLIPGAFYRISDYSPSKGWQVRKDFTVKPGETLDLGDILIEKPPQ